MAIRSIYKKFRSPHSFLFLFYEEKKGEKTNLKNSYLSKLNMISIKAVQHERPFIYE